MRTAPGTPLGPGTPGARRAAASRWSSTTAARRRPTGRSTRRTSRSSRSGARRGRHRAFCWIWRAVGGRSEVSLPERYARWREAFDVAARSSLRPDMAILDVGAGRHPTIPIAARPARCAYVGLDLSAAELADAPRGSYDE